MFIWRQWVWVINGNKYEFLDASIFVKHFKENKNILTSRSYDFFIFVCFKLGPSLADFFSATIILRSGNIKCRKDLESILNAASLVETTTFLLQQKIFQIRFYTFFFQNLNISKCLISPNNYPELNNFCYMILNIFDQQITLFFQKIFMLLLL